MPHDDVIKWKHFPRNWPFVRKIHRSPVNFPHKGQWRGALMFSLIYAWINDWANNREAGDLRRQHGHYDVIVMLNLQGRQPMLVFPCFWLAYKKVKSDSFVMIFLVHTYTPWKYQLIRAWISFHIRSFNEGCPTPSYSCSILNGD